MREVRKSLALLLAAALLLPVAIAAEPDERAEALTGAGECLLAATPTPAPGDVGGEWTVFALARMGAETPEGYYDGYLRRLEKKLKDGGGVLHARKYTEYARAVLALTALGIHPAQMGGYDLLAPLGDYDQVVWQGLMGPVMALLAMDCGGYEVPAAPEGKDQASRELYVDYILERQLADGGFALSDKGEGDPDVTAMALQALAKYLEREEVAQAVERALDFLSAAQLADGGYGSWGSANAESAAQVLVALCELGISLTDGRFVKNGCTVADGLLAFYVPGKGFSHLPGGKVDAIATEQGAYALAALIRAEAGESSLYRVAESGQLKPWSAKRSQSAPPAAAAPSAQATEVPRETPAPAEADRPAARQLRRMSWPDRGAELLKKMIGRLAPPMRGSR